MFLFMCVTAGFADLFSVKEDTEILNAKKAAFLASKVMQSWVVEKIEDIIDKNKKVKHSKLSGRSPAHGAAVQSRGRTASYQPRGEGRNINLEGKGEIHASSTRGAPLYACGQALEVD